MLWRAAGPGCRAERDGTGRDGSSRPARERAAFQRAGCPPRVPLSAPPARRAAETQVRRDCEHPAGRRQQPARAGAGGGWRPRGGAGVSGRGGAGVAGGQGALGHLGTWVCGQILLLPALPSLAPSSAASCWGWLVEGCAGRQGSQPAGGPPCPSPNSVEPERSGGRGRGRACQTLQPPVHAAAARAGV